METLDVWGGMGAQPIDLDAPLSWWSNLSRYYNLENWNTPAYHRMAALGWFVRVGLSLIPWSFFGLGIVYAVYSELQDGTLCNPLTACSQMRKRLLPLKLTVSMALLFGVIWLVGIGLRAGLNTDSTGKLLFFAALFFLGVAGFMGTFVVNALYQIFIWIRWQYALLPEDVRSQYSFPVWSVRSVFQLILTLLYALACTAGTGFLLFQTIFYCVVGNPETTLERQHVAILTALSFLPTVALNGMFWSLIPWALIRFFQAKKTP